MPLPNEIKGKRSQAKEERKPEEKKGKTAARTIAARRGGGRLFLDLRCPNGNANPVGGGGDMVQSRNRASQDSKIPAER